MKAEASDVKEKLVGDDVGPEELVEGEGDGNAAEDDVDDGGSGADDDRPA